MQIKNLEKYQPTYKDGRKLVWIRWYVDCLSDYKFAKLTPTQKWLFIGLSLIQTKEQGNIPDDFDYLCHQLQYDRKHIESDINKLQQLDLLVTLCDEKPQDVTFSNPSLYIKEERREDKRRGEKRFVPPNIEEIKSYCLERKNYINSEKFFNYYESNGWRVGKNPMKDWKAAVRTWEKNDTSPPPKDTSLKIAPINTPRNAIVEHVDYSEEDLKRVSELVKQTVNQINEKEN